MKESKSWGEKEEETILDTTGKRYTRRYHKHASKFPQHVLITHDLESSQDEPIDLDAFNMDAEAIRE